MVLIVKKEGGKTFFVDDNDIPFVLEVSRQNAPEGGPYNWQYASIVAHEHG